VPEYVLYDLKCTCSNVSLGMLSILDPVDLAQYTDSYLHNLVFVCYLFGLFQNEIYAFT
jgi:hypothetical protein